MTTQTIQFDAVSLTDIGSGTITAQLLDGGSNPMLAAIAESAVRGRYTGTVTDHVAGSFELLIFWGGKRVGRYNTVALLAADGTYVAKDTVHAALDATARVKLAADQPDYAPATASALSTLAAKFSGITLLADWLRRAFRKDAGTLGMATAEAEIQTGGTATFSGTTDNLEAIKDAGGGAGGGLTEGQQAQLNSIEAKTNLITSGTRITIAETSGSSITLKCGDDYYGDTAKRIEITDADSSLYDLLRTETLTARAFGAGLRRDAVTGTFSRDTITHTEASGSIPAYTTIFVECSVASDTPAGVTTYDIQITDASGRKHTPFSGQVTLVQDFKS